MRVRIAMVMAVVAMFGAVAAFRTAYVEQETSRLERKLDQGQMLELANRQKHLDESSLYRRFVDRFNSHADQGAYLQEKASALRQTDPAAAAQLDVKAQEEFALARAFRPFRAFAFPGLPVTTSPEDIAEQLASGDVEEYGFDVIWPPKAGGPNEDPSIWYNEAKAITASESQVIRLARSVVIFVFALAAFTFAQLCEERSKGEKIFSILGYGLGATGLIVALLIEPRAWWIYALAAAVFSMCGYAGWILSRRIKYFEKEDPEDETIHPEEVEPRLFAGMRVHGGLHAKGAFARTIVTLIAITAVLSALSGYWYSNDAAQANVAAGKALEQQVKAFKSSSGPENSVYYDLGGQATAQEYRVRRQAARQRLELAQAGEPGIASGDAQGEIGVSERMLSKQDQKNIDVLNGPDGPESDPQFPRRYVFGRLAEDPEKAFALWDAENEISLAWHKKATEHLATITLFAIALYLFGQALAMGRTRAGFILVFLSACLVVIGAGRGVITRFRAMPGRPHTVGAACREPGESRLVTDPAEDAAGHYAKGRMWYQTANGPGDYGKAASEFECAVDARPTFALANYYLSRATLERNTPQHGEGFISLIKEDALPTIVEHQDRTLDALDQEGLTRPLQLLGNHGYDNTLLGIERDDRKHLDHGIEASREALKRDGSAAWIRLNLGMGLLARGKLKEGLAEYHQGIQPGIKSDVAAGAITDLGVLAQSCPNMKFKQKGYCEQLQPEITKLKAQLVSAAWPAPASGGTTSATGPNDIHISDVKLLASPAGVGWRGRLQGLSSKEHVVTALWYAYEPEWKVWRVMPRESGAIDFSSFGERKDIRGYQFHPYLSPPEYLNCLQKGTYGAEFYINGKLVVERQDVSLDTPKFKSGMFRDLNLAACYPGNWTPWHPAGGAEPGLVRGFLDPHGDRGLFLFSYYLPKQSSEDQAKQKALQKARSYMASQGYTISSELAPNADVCWELQETTSATRARYEGGGATALTRIWVSPDGMAYVGILFTKAKNADQTSPENVNAEDCGTLVSISRIFVPY